MKYCGSLYVVEDAERTKAFYKSIFGLRVIQDFGANFTLTGGVSFQTKESWKEFIHKDESAIVYGGNDAELYFETEDIDAFVETLKSRDVIYVHPLKEHDWGQRAIRFYDPDQHIIEVAEAMKNLIKRLKVQGMSVKEIADQTMMSEKIIERILKK